MGGNIIPVEPWAQFGLIGLVVGALFVLVVFLIREMRERDREWIAAFKAVGDAIDDRQADTNKVVSELTAVVRVLQVRGGGG